MKPVTQMLNMKGAEFALVKGLQPVNEDIARAFAGGEFFYRVNGGAWECSKNLVPLEGRTHLLGVSLGNLPKASGYYLALYAGQVTPQDNWTAASFAQTSAELVSNTQGYVEANRPKWEPGSASDGVIDSLQNPALFTFAAANSTTVDVAGCALLSAEGKGASTGVLIAASRFAALRQFQDTDTFELGYRITLSPA